MRTQPVWKQDEVAPGDIFNEITSDKAEVREEQYAIDPRLPRYVFNPFRNRSLEPRYQILYQLKVNFIPERMILPLRMGTYSDVDYNSMRTDSLDASERYLPPGQRSAAGSDMKDHERLPVHNAASMLSVYAHQYGMRTGFCQITELDGVTDLSIAERVTRLCFPEPRIRRAPLPQITIDEDLAHIDTLMTDGVDDYEAIAQVFQAMNENKAWAEEHYRRIISQMDEHASNPLTGKGKADRLDVAVCGWLGVPVPRSVSKTDQGGQQKIQVEMVGQASQEIGPQIQCATCGERSNLLPDGQPPKLCRGCRTPFVEEAKGKAKKGD